jgi:DNA-binding LacI/PurR family transcriptional regulator
MTQRRMSQILQHRGIRGLIIPPLNRTLNEQNRNQRLAFDWDQFAAVSIGDMLVDPPIHRVIHDHYVSILTTMDRLLGLGYRRIGLCLTRHMDFTVNQRWQAGYRVYRANHPLGRIEPLILPDLSADAVLGWIRTHQLDAIVSAELRMPRFLKEVGLRPGKDIAFADLDLDPSLPQHRSMSGIIQNSKVLGMAAVDLVVSALNRNQLGIPDVPFVLQVEGIWRQKASTPQRCIT